MTSDIAKPSLPSTIETLPPKKRHILRCREPRIAAASLLLGIELPSTAYGTVSQNGLHALWLGPDEWLILAEALPPVSISDWTGLGASFVDVSDRQIALQVSGPKADLCLASGCPLDLAAGAFPVGATTRTVFHKAEIILWRTGEHRYHLEVWRSFAPYVVELLEQASKPV